MIKIVTSLVSTAVGLALVLSFKSHTAGAPKSALGDTGSVSGSSPSAPPVAGAGDGKTTATKSPSRTKKRTTQAAASGTFAGKRVETPYGPMQVAAVITGGRLTDVKVLRKTDTGSRSVEIDAQSLPVLKSEALAAHSANIDVVSGATYTSEGYAKSLQSALAKGGV